MRTKHRNPILCKGDIVIPGYGIMTDALVYLRLEADMYINYIKYKRCLMMYRYCAIKASYELDFKGNDVKWKWYSKWMHKWFNLAERFKEYF